MPPLLSIISSSWDFCKKQQAVTHATFWFLFFPGLCSLLLAEIEVQYEPILSGYREMNMLLGVAYFAMMLVILWGMVCVLSVGKRLVQGKAGRSRTSLATVSRQARHLFLPFLLTSILRNIFTLLWGILLIIPGIIYYVRTVFFPVVIVCEGVSYRQALKRSSAITKGQFWNVLFASLLLGILTILLPQFVSGLFMAIAEGAPWPIVIAASVASSILVAIGLTFYLLSLIQLYAWFKPGKAGKPRIEMLKAK